MKGVPAPLLALVAVGYLAATFYFGTLPPSGLPGGDHDKLLHALCFGCMVLVSFPAVQAALRRFPAANGWLELGTAAYAVSVGALLEVVQSALPSRHADLLDVAADAVGAGLGYLLLVGAKAWRRAAPS